MATETLSQPIICVYNILSLSSCYDQSEFWEEWEFMKLKNGETDIS